MKIYRAESWFWKVDLREIRAYKFSYTNMPQSNGNTSEIPCIVLDDKVNRFQKWKEVRKLKKMKTTVVTIDEISEVVMDDESIEVDVEEIGVQTEKQTSNGSNLLDDSDILVFDDDVITDDESVKSNSVETIPSDIQREEAEVEKPVIINLDTSFVDNTTDRNDRYDEKNVYPAESDLDYDMNKESENSIAADLNNSNENADMCINDVVMSRVEGLVEKFGKTGLPLGDMFSCPKCNKFKTKEEAEMVNHLYKEIKTLLFVCTHCKRMSSSREGIKKHYLNIHAKSGKVESYAPLRPDLQNMYWVEYVISSQIEAMKNEQCSKKNESTAEFNGTNEDNHKEFQCRACPEMYFSEGGLITHLQAYHLKLDSWTCGQCKFISQCKSDILKHMAGSQHSCFQHLIPATVITLNTKFWDSYFKVKNSGSNSSKSLLSSQDKQVPKVLSLTERNLRSKSKSSSLVLMQKNNDTSPEKVLSNKNKLKKCCPCTQSKYMSNEDITLNVAHSPRKICSRIEENCEEENQYLYTCFYCPMLSQSEKSARKHWKFAHKSNFSENTKTEEEYSFNFEKWKPDDYFLQLYEAGKISRYYCGYCMVMSTDFLLIRKHISENHQGCDMKIVFVRPVSYCCILCEMVLSSLDEIFVHFEEKHSGKRLLFEVQRVVIGNFRLSQAAKSEFLENICNRNTTSDKQNKINVDNSEQKPKYYCYWCKETFDSRFSFILHHIGMHWELMPTKKEILIDSPMASKTYSKVTISPVDVSFMVTNEKEYSCPYCLWRTTLFEALFYHLFQHALPFKCFKCGFMAESAYEVHKHSRSLHSTIIPTIVHLSMLDDVIGRLLCQVNCVELQVDHNLNGKKKLVVGNDEVSGLSKTSSEITMKRNMLLSQCYLKRRKLKERPDYSQITVRCKLDGTEEKTVSVNELSKYFDIDPCISITDCKNHFHS